MTDNSHARPKTLIRHVRTGTWDDLSIAAGAARWFEAVTVMYNVECSGSELVVGGDHSEIGPSQEDPVPLEDAFRLFDGVDQIVVIADPACVEGLSGAISKHTPSLIVVSPYVDVLLEVQEQVGANPAVTTGLRWLPESAAALTHGDGPGRLLAACDPTYAVLPWDLASDGLLHACGRPVVVELSDDEDISTALADHRIIAIVPSEFAAGVAARKAR